MISGKMSSGVVTVCTLALLFSLSVVGSPWAGTYLFSDEIQVGTILNTLVAPLDIDIGPNGKMFIVENAVGGRVIQLDEFDDNFWQCNFPFSFIPLAISADNTGNFYYVTKWNGTDSEVVKYPANKSCGFPADTLVPPVPFNAPFGIDVSPDGSVYVADTDNDRIVKFNANGDYVAEWVTFLSGNDFFHGPMDVVAYSNEIILVADSDADRIVGFNGNGVYLGEAGNFGTGPLEFDTPSGITIGPDNGIFVSDTGNNRIQKGFIDPAFEGIFGLDTVLSSPNGLAVDKGGNVSVADIGNDRIAVFTSDVIVFDKGADSKAVNMPGQVSINIDLNPDAYWNNVPVEVFAFAGGAGLGDNVAYLTVYPSTGDILEWGINDIALIPPLPGLTGINLGVANGIPWVAVNDSTGLAGDWEVSVCLDRNINGAFNPSSSVCDSISVTIQ